jgi:crossover junction endodeoxyribonuclease RuvC
MSTAVESPVDNLAVPQLTVLGLDLSLTSTGVCKAVGGALGGDPWFFTIKSARSGYERLDSQINRIGLAVQEIQPDVIVVEGPALHAKGAYFHENAGLFYAITHRIWKSGRPWAQVPPTVLKKFATGKGGGPGTDKGGMRVAASYRFGLAEIGPDEADALWLAAAGLQHYGYPLVKLPILQVDALEALGKTKRPVVAWPALPVPAVAAVS